MRSVLPIAGSSNERGEAVVVATNVLQQSYEIFKSSTSDEVVGNVNFPLYCHWKKRSKHGFLFTGQIQNGIGPVVQCRIKFSRWKRIYHKDICRAMTVKV